MEGHYLKKPVEPEILTLCIVKGGNTFQKSGASWRILSFLLEDLKSVILTIPDNQYIHQLWITYFSDLYIQTEAKPQ